MTIFIWFDLIGLHLKVTDLKNQQTNTNVIWWSLSISVHSLGIHIHLSWKQPAVNAGHNEKKKKWDKTHSKELCQKAWECEATVHDEACNDLQLYDTGKKDQNNRKDRRSWGGVCGFT